MRENAITFTIDPKDAKVLDDGTNPL